MKDSSNIKENTVDKSAVALGEEATLAFWHEHKIFEKTLEKNSGRASKDFVFYDGPPFATGQPHYGHILPGTIKDVIPRYKTMRGYNVRRQWGWDCHGLPIENLIEKKLGLKNKREILELGIDKFNAEARASVMNYADEWKRIIPRTGRFVNMDDDYKTMDTSYTESVWWSFKTLYDKGLVYEGFKSMLLCPRCETTLSNFEVNQGYRDITDISVYVKFELIDHKGSSGTGSDEEKGKGPTYLLAWTTTPWTLPGNAALAVNPDVDYVTIDVDGSNVILAKPRLPAIQMLMKKEYEVVFEQKGSALIGRSYRPLFDHYAKDPSLKNRQNGWKVYGADFVTTEDGTGVVHIAPAFGADDMALGDREKLPFIQHVSQDGRFKPEVDGFAGQSVKPKDTDEEPNAHQKADIEIIKYLSRVGSGMVGTPALFAKEKIIHSYPHCWRCDTPLLNYATSSWFVKVTAIKDELVSLNKKVEWIPENIKDGRFGKWLEGAKDWAVSRSRFWGAPLPVWRCDACKRLEVFGSIDQLKAKITPNTRPDVAAQDSNIINNYLVMRHGQADSNVMHVIGSDRHTFHLTELGKKEVAQSAESLMSMKSSSIDLIICSPYNRTKETAEIIRSSLGLSRDQVIEDDRIQEVKAGIFNGKDISEYRSYFKTIGEHFTKAPPQGENYNDIRKRMGDFLYDIDRKYKGKNILIVTHDLPARLLFADAQGLDQKQVIKGYDIDRDFLHTAEFRPLKFVQFPHNDLYETDLHRPFIDDVVYDCRIGSDPHGHGDHEGVVSKEHHISSSCHGKMKRVPEVFDTWYDSGSMPFASHHYPFENLGEFDPRSSMLSSVFPFLHHSVGFPADFIAEGLDQTRGWFYTLFVLSAGLFGKAPYKSVVVNGLVLAEDGRKMSKKLKNYPEISTVMDKYGADALRYFLMASPAVHAEDVNFSEKGVDEVYKKLILRLQNVCSFYEMYADHSASNADHIKDHGKDRTNVLDLWIQARLDQVVSEVTAALESYRIDRAAWPLDGFIDDLSTWYLRRSRDRFKSEKDSKEALATTRFVLKQFSKICAPFMPFISEEVYQKVRHPKDPESVHLEDWLLSGDEPLAVVDIDSKIIKEMAETRRIVSLGLEARSKAGIKVRQPLSQLKLAKNASSLVLSSDMLTLIKDEVNVKSVIYQAGIKDEVELDIIMTEELMEEGVVRELIRSIQDLRKKEDLQPSDIVGLHIDLDMKTMKIVESKRDLIIKSTNLNAIEMNVSDSGSLSMRIKK